MTLLYVYFAILWMFFWSFASVIIDRLKNKKSWIFLWRSECPNCKHKLGFKDLIPLISFISTLWKCRYCSKKVSFLYPILEVVTGILFFLVSYFLVDLNLVFSGNVEEILKLTFYLLFSFFTIVYVFYDILYLEIPDSILFILISLSYFFIWIQAFFWLQIFDIFTSLSSFSLYENIYLFSLWIIIIWLLYLIMLKWFSYIYDFLIILWIIFSLWFTKYYLWIDLEKSIIWSSILWLFFSFLFFFFQIVISSGRWMWWWDLRISILLWIILWYSYYFYWIISSYFVWAVIWIFVIVYSKTRAYYLARKSFLNKVRGIIWLSQKTIEIDTQIPFWPFLAFWIFFVLVFFEKISEFFTNIYL